VSTRLAHLRGALLASAALALAGAGLAGAVRGPAAAWGVLAGVALVVASYTASSALLAWAESINPRLLLSVGLGAYVVKFTLIGVMMAGLAGTGWSGLPAMGVAIILAVVVWSAAQIWWAARLPPA
jgi:hypothetical protein